MSAKSKAPAKKRGRPVGSKTNQAKAKPKGLQLTTAQRTAYNKAYNATAQSLRQKIFQKAAAQAFRKYRLGAAYATVRQYNIQRGRAQAAAVAFNATRMTFRQSKLAHQNAALTHRVTVDMLRHATLLGRAQYAQAGEKAYAHTAVMRTVDMSQAMSHEAALLKKAARIGRKAARGNRKFPKGPNSAAINAAANKAGLAAAARIKTSPAVARKTAQQPVQKSGRKPGRPVGSGKQAPPATQASKKGSGTSKKAPVKNAKARTAQRWPPGRTPPPADQHIDLAAWGAAMASAHAALVAGKATKPKIQPWLGDETTPNCIIIALANHLLQHKIIRVTARDIEELTADCGEAPTIEEVLWQAWLTGWPFSDKVRLVDYWAAEKEVWDEAGLLIGFEVQTDDGLADHAALALADHQVVSWGAVADRKAPVEEAWQLEWRT